MSINSFTNYSNKDFLFLETNSNTCKQEAQNIESIARSLEASALEFQSQQSRKRKVQPTTIETLEQ